MITFDISEIRKFAKMLAPTADFDGAYTFYYDETNNIKKFYVRESDFNSLFTENFVLGGLVHEGSAPDVQPLINSFKLQRTVKEVKLKLRPMARRVWYSEHPQKDNSFGTLATNLAYH